MGLGGFIQCKTNLQELLKFQDGMSEQNYQFYKYVLFVPFFLFISEVVKK